MIRTRPSIPRIAWPSVRHKAQTRCAAAGTVAGAPRVPRRSSRSAVPHWTGDKLETTEKYPLTVSLSKAIHPNIIPKEADTKRRLVRGKTVTTSGIHVRTQIVSPNLCDDVIKYIGHTLDQHKGCDILDINPGAGLWSQTLHKYLKPRSHVLLEPRPEMFKDYLDPLLTKRGSKYSLVSKDPLHLDTYRDMVADGIFSHQKPKEVGDAKAQELNSSLLVTGSLMWDPRLPGFGFDSMAKQLFHHFTSSALTNDIFHAFGTVRMLLWVQHDDFGGQLAEAVSGMQKANRFLEMSQQLNVVVHPDYTERPLGRGVVGRDPRYTIESTIRALNSGKEKGMKLPARRREPVHYFAEDIEKISGGTGITRSAEMFDYLHGQHLKGRSVIGLLPEAAIDLFETEKAVCEKYPDVEIKPMGKMGAARTSTANHPDPVIRKDLNAYYKKRSSLMQIQKTRQAAEAIADIGEDLYYLECKILRMEKGANKDAAMEKLEELDVNWKTELDKLPFNYHSVPDTDLDDRLSLRTPPYSRIQWDSRPYEPLIMRRDEVWPRNSVTLIDATPIPRTAEHAPDYFEWQHDFVYGLFSASADSVEHALDKMQHGLSDIIDQCPSLRDPAKGGRLQMKHLRVRMLTQEMIDELVEAYRNWPFKAPGSEYSKYFRNKGSALQAMSTTLK